jgi:hypothetical protein
MLTKSVDAIGHCQTGNLAFIHIHTGHLIGCIGMRESLGTTAYHGVVAELYAGVVEIRVAYMVHTFHGTMQLTCTGSTHPKRNGIGQRVMQDMHTGRTTSRLTDIVIQVAAAVQKLQGKRRWIQCVAYNQQIQFK